MNNIDIIEKSILFSLKKSNYIIESAYNQKVISLYENSDSDSDDNAAKSIMSSIKDQYNSTKDRISSMYTDRIIEKCNKIMENKINQNIEVPQYTEWQKLCDKTIEYEKKILDIVRDIDSESVDIFSDVLKGIYEEFDKECEHWIIAIQNNIYSHYRSSLTVIKDIKDYRKKYIPILDKYRDVSLGIIENINKLYMNESHKPDKNNRILKQYLSSMKMISKMSNNLILIYSKYPIKIMKEINSVNTDDN